MKDPCINCKQEYPRCRRICPYGVAYQDELRQKREKAKAAEREESQFSAYKFDRIQDTVKKIAR